MLANLYLNPLDHEMAERGWEMVRYADDFVVLLDERGKLLDSPALSSVLLSPLERENLTALARLIRANSGDRNGILAIAYPGAGSLLSQHLGDRDPS